MLYFYTNAHCTQQLSKSTFSWYSSVKRLHAQHHVTSVVGPSAQHVLSGVWRSVCREPGSGASVEGWVADSRQRADRRALAFEEGEGEDEEANAHDAQDDHA